MLADGFILTFFALSPALHPGMANERQCLPGPRELVWCSASCCGSVNAHKETAPANELSRLAFWTISVSPLTTVGDVDDLGHAFGAGGGHPEKMKEGGRGERRGGWRGKRGLEMEKVVREGKGGLEMEKEREKELERETGVRDGVGVQRGKGADGKGGGARRWALRREERKEGKERSEKKKRKERNEREERKERKERKARREREKREERDEIRTREKRKNDKKRGRRGKGMGVRR